MTVGISISIALLMMSTTLEAQKGPSMPLPPSAATPLPTLDGTIHYALSASEIVQFGYFGRGNVTPETVLSGDVSYTSPNLKTPFNLLFAGGILLPNRSSLSVTTYQNLAVSQGLHTGRWVLNVSDSVSYLPQSPTTGLSGIPGVGDIGGIAVNGPSAGPAGGVLTTSGSRLSNDLSGGVERLITGKTSISGSGSWTVLRFVSGTNGLDNESVSGQVGVNHRIDARDSVSANGVYSVFTFGARANGLSFTSRGVNGVYSRVLGRSLTLSASAGPQWIVSSNSAVIPSNVSVAADIGLSYLYKLTTATLGYVRGVNAGSGVQAGAKSDEVTAAVGHPLGRDWLASASAAYIHSASLVKNPLSVGLVGGGFQTTYGGVQVTHSLSRSSSVYLSYTAQHQTYDATFAGQNAFNGTSQTIGVGISFAPRATRLGQF